MWLTGTVVMHCAESKGCEYVGAGSKFAYGSSNRGVGAGDGSNPPLLLVYVKVESYHIEHNYFKFCINLCKIQ